MKGYLSFILVFASVLLLTSLLLLRIETSSVDLSKSISAERTYGIQMNIRESVLESARLGAQSGFDVYDNLHDIHLCKHCIDNFCTFRTPQNPNPPNFCDPALCSGCFREADARSGAVAGAVLQTALLSSYLYHTFDPDFNSSINSLDVGVIEVFLKPNVLSKNGFSLDYLRFRSDVSISVASQKFNITSAGKIPRGMVIHHE